VNSRTLRERQMLLMASVVFVIAFDYLLLVRPITQLFSKTIPALSSLKRDIQGLQEDKRNEKIIQKKLENLKTQAVEAKKRFIAPNEIPLFLEDLSKTAQGNGVKIISLKPVEKPKAADTSHYIPISIKINAVAATHAFGRFLAKLESGKIFIRVTDLKIAGGAQDPKKHDMELTIETYRQE
jgi:Tfp pilus assembly protein PilO